MKKTPSVFCASVRRRAVRSSRLSRTSFTIAAYRASRSVRYAAISTFASSTAARNRAVFSTLAIASTRLTSVIALVDRSTTSFIQSQSFIHSFIHALARRRPHAPSLAAPTMACASFSAIMSLEIPSARVASMIARSNARRLRLPSRVSSLAVVADPRGFPFLHETVRDDGVRTPSNAGAREEGGGVSTHTRTHRRITIRKQPPPSHPRGLASIAGRPSLGARARRTRRHSTTTKMFASTTSATTTMFASGGAVSAKFRATAAPARAPTRVVIESA